MPHLNLAFSPDDPQPVVLATAIHVALGMMYNAGPDWADNPQDNKALNQYQQALQLEPNWDIANYYYGYGLQKLGRTTQAQAAFTKTLKIAHGSVKIAARKALSKLKAPA
jgi:tetratricopeptide (TPR) repeat protein